MRDGGDSGREASCNGGEGILEASSECFKKTNPSEDECCTVSGIESGQTGGVHVRLRRSIRR
jgi:hypothetical protein